MCVQMYNTFAHLNNLNDIPGTQDGGVKLHVTFVGCQGNDSLLHPCLAHESTFNQMDTRGTGHALNLCIRGRGEGGRREEGGKKGRRKGKRESRG